MIILETERLILRDFEEKDIEKRVFWETVETEWKKWDAPWLREFDIVKDNGHEIGSPGETKGDTDTERLTDFVKGLQAFAGMISRKKPEDMRYAFEIDLKENREYIGYISCYCIDDKYNYTDDDGKFAFGIDIPMLSHRGHGYGFEAFYAVVNYLAEHGLEEIYVSTWSGNTAMMALAGKLGFREINRKPGARIVNGEKYDAVTFIYRKQ